MLNVDKLRNRKSRAPWQNQNNKNPYANDTSKTVNSLQVPNPYANDSNSKKQDRRLSIHASAHQRQHGRSFSLVNEMPPVPALPNKQLPIESKTFNDLSQGSASQIDDYYKALMKEKELITRNIKNNINLNQQNILRLTQDLKIVQDELIDLRKSTREVLEVTNFFKQAAEKKLELEFQPQQQEKKKDRSSVIMLENMWKKELQSLYKHVDGASKFIQPLPGRHVIAESGRWIEVNAGTWKHGNATHIFVLNDLLLIASKSTDKRLHATQCFPLNQVSLKQVTSPTNNDNELNYINVNFQNLSYIFLSDRYDHFVKIMDAFKKGKQELEQASRLKQKPIENEVRNSRKRNSEELLNNMSTKTDFKDNFDEIEVYIHYNEFHKALELINHVKQKLSKKIVINEEEQLLVLLTETKLDQKKDEIIAGLEFQMINNTSHIKLPEMLSLYQKLGCLEDGITIYLKSCTIDYRNSLVAILNLKKRMNSLIPTIKSDSVNSSLVIRWCTEETKKIAENLNCDKSILTPYLNEFKEMGINLDYLFYD